MRAAVEHERQTVVRRCGRRGVRLGRLVRRAGQFIQRAQRHGQAAHLLGGRHDLLVVHRQYHQVVGHRHAHVRLQIR